MSRVSLRPVFCLCAPMVPMDRLKTLARLWALLRLRGGHCIDFAILRRCRPIVCDCGKRGIYHLVGGISLNITDWVGD